MKLTPWMMVGTGFFVVGLVVGVALGLFKCARDEQHVSQVLLHAPEDQARDGRRLTRRHVVVVATLHGLSSARCPECGKPFTRRDTLEQQCGDTGTDGET